MKLIQSIDDYLVLLKKSKQGYDRVFTNSYISIEVIKRYINLKRLYYIQQEKGIFFLCDEEKYYRLLYWLEPESKISLSKLDKPIAIRNIYKEGKKKEDLVFLEMNLGQLGFKNEYTAIEMYVPLQAAKTIEKQKETYQRILKKGNFKITYMKTEDLEQMLQMRETKEFHVYNFEYRTPEEYITEIKNKQYWAIYNEQQIMCACIYTKPVFQIMTGDGICVEKKYRGTYGLGAALMCHVLDEAINGQKKQYFSWCELENVNSMKFHESIGFEKTGKISNEWVMG